MSDLTNTSNRAVNGSVSTVEDSMNSSTQAVHGSSSSVQGREVVSYTYRDNANDYPNNIQSTNLELNQERPITSNNPKDVIIKDGIFDRILSSIKSLDDKSIELNKSYRRKFYWHFWEKNKGRYSSYGDFKTNWDTNTDITTQIRKEANSNIKSKIRDALNLDSQRNKSY